MSRLSSDVQSVVEMTKAHPGVDGLFHALLVVLENAPDVFDGALPFMGGGDVRPFPAPYLIPAGTTTSDGSCPVSSRLAAGAAGAATRQHNRHPGRPPRIRTTTFPLRPPRLRDDPVGDDGLYLLEQAHPDRPASYAVRVPRCRDSPRASFPPRLATTQLPPARS